MEKMFLEFLYHYQAETRYSEYLSRPVGPFSKCCSLQCIQTTGQEPDGVASEGAILPMGGHEQDGRCGESR